MRPVSIVAILSLIPLLPACSGEERLSPLACDPFRGAGGFEVGDAEGHPDPLGAKAAGQARAGRIRDAAAFPQPAHGRQRIEEGDFVLANGRIAAVIEDRGLSDGYGRFGGELIAVDAIGEDGRPRGVSRYLETLAGIGVELIDPESVAVLRDGADGGEAVVRVAGTLRPIPFMEGSLGSLFPRRYGLAAAQDFVLEPGAEVLRVRLHVVNPRPEPIDFGVERTDTDEFIGFFHHSHSRMVTPELAYAAPEGFVSWVGFDGGPWSFAWRSPRGPLEFGLTQSGFALFWGDGFAADACSVTTIEQAEIIAGGPHDDGLREAVRRVDGEAPWRAVSGSLLDAAGAPVAGAWIHALDAAGHHVGRTRTGDDGSFSIHAPPSDDVILVPRKRGYPAHAGVTAPPGEESVSLAFAPHAVLHVVATDADSGGPLPVRVQVIPAEAQPATPAEFGDLDEVGGRLHQDFAVTGEATLPVPPGEHRVIVSRGYEWELADVTVTAAAGETLEIAAPLVRSVDSTGLLCADFHVHSWFSADSSDSLEHKVKGAVADGLDIPVSSEHEWVADFQPVIERLGLTQWAFGVASEELTTFTFGHFGVVPLEPHEHEVNAGAIDWIGKDPASVFQAVRARPEAPALIINHPSSSAFGGYFRAAQYDRDAGHGDPAMWSDDFDAVEVFNASDLEENRDASLADWFSLLDHGHRVFAVGSSDSHHIRTSPVGYPRTCMWFGHDDPAALTPDAVRDALGSGASTVSGGLTMTVSGPNGERPGETVLAPGGAATLTVTVQAPSWIRADTLETFVNGESISVEPLLPLGAGPGKRFVNQVQVSVDASRPRTWVVFHAKGETDLAPLHPGKRPFAASNPVFLQTM
ncbi:MAG: CehA/McbA family metallohydrolase [Polyangiaceae bacterium]|nr:CehA/McbA family metallohydrolase [Polyangiaceae bacterium]